MAAGGRNEVGTKPREKGGAGKTIGSAGVSASPDGRKVGSDGVLIVVV
jgi:hypothetical protein